jgi:hypothetical protein
MSTPPKPKIPLPGKVPPQIQRPQGSPILASGTAPTSQIGMLPSGAPPPTMLSMTSGHPGQAIISGTPTMTSGHPGLPTTPMNHAMTSMNPALTGMNPAMAALNPGMTIGLMPMRFNPYFLPLQGVPGPGYAPGLPNGPPPNYMMPPPGHGMMHSSPAMIQPANSMQQAMISHLHGRNIPPPMMRGIPMTMPRGQPPTTAVTKPPVHAMMQNRATSGGNPSHFNLKAPASFSQQSALPPMAPMKTEVHTTSSQPIPASSSATTGSAPAYVPPSESPYSTSASALASSSQFLGASYSGSQTSLPATSLPPSSSSLTAVTSTSIAPFTFPRNLPHKFTSSSTKRHVESILDKEASRKSGYGPALGTTKPTVNLSAEQEKKLVELCHDFVHNTIEQACQLARIRQQESPSAGQDSTLLFEDVAFVLDRQYGISIPPPIVQDSAALTSESSLSITSEHSSSALFSPHASKEAPLTSRLPKRRPMPAMPSIAMKSLILKKAVTASSIQKRKATNTPAMSL